MIQCTKDGIGTHQFKLTDQNTIVYIDKLLWVVYQYI